MIQERFEEFFRLASAYNYAAASEGVELLPDTTIKACFYLSCEENSFIEYGDFELGNLEQELQSVLVADGYMDGDGRVTERVGRILKWQVWAKFYNDYEPYAGVYLFDYDDNGVTRVDEFFRLENIE